MVQPVKEPLSFVVLGPPAPWHVHTRWSKSKSKARLKEYQEAIRKVARLSMGGLPPYEGPVRLDMEFIRPIPSWAPKRAAARDRWCAAHILKPPDRDNYCKGAQDALEGSIYHRDSQVTTGQISKRYAEVGGTSFLVEFL